MSTHVYREPFPCDEACEHLDPPCPGGHAVVVTWHNASAITSIHVEPGSPQSGLWLDMGGVSALRLALAREDGSDPRDARIAALEAEVARLEALILQINDDLGRTWDTGLVDAEALRIRSRVP